MTQPATEPIIDQVRRVAVQNTTTDASLPVLGTQGLDRVVPHPPSEVRRVTPVRGDVTR